jgi:hypothetical protein
MTDVTMPVETGPAEADQSLVAGDVPTEHVLTPEELERLPLHPAGEELAEQSVYIDVYNLASGPFRALPGQTAGSGHGYVAELAIDPATWDHLCKCAGSASLAAQGEAPSTTESNGTGA